MDNQTNNQEPVNQIPVNSQPSLSPEPAIPEPVEGIEVSPQPTTPEIEITPEPEITSIEPVESAPSNDYQQVLNQYSASQPQNPVVKEAPQSTEQQLQDLGISVPPKAGGGFFKVLFVIALIIFIFVISALAFIYFKSQNNTDNSGSNFDTIKTTPTTTQTGTCFLNDKTYQTGESFASADGCNTCSCESQDVITCTEKACLSTTPAPATTSAIPKDWQTYTDSKLGFSFKYPSNWTLNKTDDYIIFKNNASETFTIYFSPIGRGFEGVTSFIKYDASIKNNLISLSNKTEKTSKTLETADGNISTKGYVITTTADKYTFIMEGVNVSSLNNGISSFEQIISTFKFN